VDVNERSFGLAIAYVIPGWILLVGMSYRWPAINTWLSGPVSSSPTIGGFLFATLASIGLGVFVSTTRWLTIEPLLHRTGVRVCTPNFAKLTQTHEAISLLIDGHYRYYQFHANLCVALPVAAMFRWLYHSFAVSEFVILLVLLGILLIGARDTLSKYYSRSRDVLLQD
jgi:hypothetical protein